VGRDGRRETVMGARLTNTVAVAMGLQPKVERAMPEEVPEWTPSTLDFLIGKTIIRVDALDEGYLIHFHGGTAVKVIADHRFPEEVEDPVPVFLVHRERTVLRREQIWAPLVPGTGE
jgi:hypothetical protein